MNFSIAEWYVESYILPIRGVIGTRFLRNSAVYTLPHKYFELCAVSAAKISQTFAHEEWSVPDHARFVLAKV